MAQARLSPVVGQLRRLAGAPPMPELTDAQLLQHFLTHRDEAAFATLVERHGRLVLAVCRSILRHEQDAEDAFQATFLVLARQAGSIRRTAAVGSWLYRVAHRIATKAGTAMARRRVHERQVDLRCGEEPASEAAWRELQAVFRDEVDRLPEKYRAPFVLCCLEGQSGAEAARQLGWKEGTVTGRLTLARRLLQERLARRGIALATLLTGLAATRSTQAALPAALVTETVHAAVEVAARGLAAGLVSEKVAALAEGGAGGLSVGQLKIATLLLTVGLLAVGAGLFAQRDAAAEPTPPPPQPASAPPPPAKPAPVPVLQENGGTVAINGRVLDPDGKPVTGAEVSIGWYLGYALAWFPPVLPPLRPERGATTGTDGRFRASFTEADCFALMGNAFQKPWRKTQIVAAAKGYGPGSAWLEHVKGELTLRLVRDDVPIRGRVLDLQGRPVAGVHVRVAYLTYGKDYLTQAAWAGLAQNVTTGPDGRFVLTGVGRDRVAHLHVEGPTVEHKLVAVDTIADMGKKGDHGRIEVVVGPTKPIEGVIRARDTGNPLAGVVIYGNRENYRGGVQTVTDDQGHYRLVGLPKASSYELTVAPPVALGYLGRIRYVSDSEGLKPLTADFELRRGAPLRFRVVDQATGKPIRAAVVYSPLHENPLYSESEDHAGYFPTPTFREWHFPGKDHTYYLTAYPGPGVLFAFVGHDGARYVRAELDPADKQAVAPRDPVLGFLNLSEGYRIIRPDRTDKAVVFDIAVRPEKRPQAK